MKGAWYRAEMYACLLEISCRHILFRTFSAVPVEKGGVEQLVGPWKDGTVVYESPWPGFSRLD
jgi:hypothetical protein